MPGARGDEGLPGDYGARGAKVKGVVGGMVGGVVGRVVGGMVGGVVGGVVR